MSEEQFLKLLEGYKLQQLSKEELFLFLDAAEDPRFEIIMGEEFIKDLQARRDLLVLNKEREDKVWAKIEALRKPHIPGNITRSRNYSIGRWVAAAAIITVIATDAYFWLGIDKDPGIKQIAVAETLTDIEPGKDGAILTLADGTRVVLDSMRNGVVAMQNGVEIVLKDGLLAYDPTAKTGEVSYNIMTTPKGRQFSLVLPDGSKLWLNAESSVRYPTSFPGSERKVTITGEAYFEVARNIDQPFKVSVANDIEVEVLGTHFNINAYTNEKLIHTTLLEGKVRIKKDNESTELMPGQQAQLATNILLHNDHSKPFISVVNNVNLDKVMSWKNGVFDFQDAHLEEVMRQLERWYNIEVMYEKDIPDIEFIGKMGRDLTLSNVLRGLEMSKVHFRLEGRKLIVMP